MIGMGRERVCVVMGAEPSVLGCSLRASAGSAGSSGMERQAGASRAFGSTLGTLAPW
jgi:hypothetical protein